MKTNKKTKHIIDMHTHMFNAHYLPLRGIFKSFDIPDKFNKPLAYICWFLTDASKFENFKHTTPEHIITLEDYDNNYPELWVSRVSDSYISAISSSTANMLKVCLNGKLPDKALLDKLLNEDTVDIEELNTIDLGVLTIKTTLDAINIKAGSNEIFDIFNDTLNGQYPLKDLFENFLKEAFHKIEHALDYLDFIWNISRSEGQIYKRLKAFYESMDVNCDFIHYMMDMAHPYINNMGHKKYGATRLRYISKKGEKSQLSQMDKLSVFSKGQVTGFAAFDPWRFHTSKNITRDVISALDEMLAFDNIIGMKFYPPMGYRPDENHNTYLQKAINVFYAYCLEKDVPIFVHCSPGAFEIRSGSGELSNPIYWRRLFENTPKWADLRLCLGHAGGGKYLNEHSNELISLGWVAHETEWNHQGNYASECVALCKDFKNIYCELSNITSVLTNKNFANNLSINLKRELNKKDGRFHFHNKIIYGTDWHMVGIVNQLVNYYTFISNMFNEAMLADFKTAFFYDNAAAYLRLDT